MDKILGNFLGYSSNDFPLDCETLDSLQNNTLLSEVIGNVCGDKAILWGCTTQGATVGNGYIFARTEAYPAGEVLPLVGGNITSAGGKVTIKEVAQSVTADAVTYQRAYIKRYAQIENGDGEVLTWADFTRITSVQDLATSIASANNVNDAQTEAIATLQAALGTLQETVGGHTTAISAINATIAGIDGVPVGTILMWPAADAPEKYVLCDGRWLSKTTYAALFDWLGSTYGAATSTEFRVPDMRGRFVAGKGDGGAGFTAADYDTLGETGGEEKVTLAAAESGLPSHSHTLSYRSSHDSNTNNNGDIARGNDTSVVDESKTTSSAGGTSAQSAHENRPPYIVLSYIIKVQ